MKVEIYKSDKPDKKYKIVVLDGKTKKTIHIGSKGMDDYTTHKDVERKDRYISRHRARENWTKTGIKTAGFWAYHLLWNKPSIAESIKDIKQKFNIEIFRKF